MSYYSGFLLAVPTANKQKYIELARDHWPMFKQYGALRMVEAWGVDVPHGKVTDFYMSTQAKEDETIVFSWIEWPDRATCDEAGRRMEADMAGMEMPEMPFDGMRMFWGGFTPVFDSRVQG